MIVVRPVADSPRLALGLFRVPGGLDGLTQGLAGGVRPLLSTGNWAFRWAASASCMAISDAQASRGNYWRRSRRLLDIEIRRDGGGGLGALAGSSLHVHAPMVNDHATSTVPWFASARLDDFILSTMRCTCIPI